MLTLSIGVPNDFMQIEQKHRLCPKSLTTPYIVHYIVTTLFCSAVQMSSGKYYTLYSALKVSHNASRKVVYNWWSLTEQYLQSCIALSEKMVNERRIVVAEQELIFKCE